MAEVHIVGQFVGAADFPLPSLFCKFSVEAGSNFRLLQGVTSGQTQCDMPPVRTCIITPNPCFSARDSHILARFILFRARRRARWPRLATQSTCTITIKGIDGWRAAD